MISICHLIESFRMGGAERGLYNLVANRNDLNLSHRIIAFNDGPLRDEFSRLGIDTEVIERESTWDFHFFFKLFKTFRLGGCDVVHARNSSTAIVWGGFAAFAAGIPVVTSVHGYNMLHKRGAKARLWLFMHRLAKATISVSESLANELISRGTPSVKVVAIRNGLDLQAYRTQMLPPEDRLALRHTVVGTGKVRLVGCIGSLRAVKGQDFLLDAVAMLSPAFADAKFLLVGAGPDLALLQNKAHKLGIDHRVIFLGFRRDVFSILQTLDLVVVPSQSEGISNIILEALAFGVPVVATAVGGTPEVIRDGENGLLAPYGDAGALAAAISNVLQNAELCSRLIQNGTRRMAAEFSLQRMVDQYETVYRKVANR